MFAAPFLWLGKPFPIALWGLPMPVRKRVASFFVRDSIFRRGLSAATTPGVAWLAFITIYLGWHDPNLYNAALRIPWVHDLEHVTFFGSALLFWWHALNAAPHIHGRIPVWERIAMTVSIIPANMIAGITIATANQVIYTYYETVPHIWGFTALQDQATGGMIMWVPGSEMIVWAVIFQLSTLTRREKSKAQATARESQRETLPV
jgi:putative membrane protein